MSKLTLKIIVLAALPLAIAPTVYLPQRVAEQAEVEMVANTVNGSAADRIAQQAVSQAKNAVWMYGGGTMMVYYGALALYGIKTNKNKKEK